MCPLPSLSLSREEGIFSYPHPVLSNPIQILQAKSKRREEHFKEKEEVDSDTTGWMIWPTAQLFCDFLIDFFVGNKDEEMHLKGLSSLKKSFISEVSRKINILEVGGGTGIVGILSSKIFDFENCVLTDLPDQLPQISENVKLNEKVSLKGGGGGAVEVKALPWGCEEGLETILAGMRGEEGRKFDLIIASEVIYKQGEEVFDKLVSTFRGCASEHVVFLVAYEFRGSLLEDFHFFERMEQEFGAPEVVFLDRSEEGEEENRLLYVYQK